MQIFIFDFLNTFFLNNTLHKSLQHKNNWYLFINYER